MAQSSHPFTGQNRPMGAIALHGMRSQGAADARHRPRRRTVVLQVPGNATDVVPRERVPIINQQLAKTGKPKGESVMARQAVLQNTALGERAIPAIDGGEEFQVRVFINSVATRSGEFGPKLIINDMTPHRLYWRQSQWTGKC